MDLEKLAKSHHTAAMVDPGRRKFCEFRGCSGSCHYCGTRQRQRSDAGDFEKIIGVLSGEALSGAARTLLQNFAVYLSPVISEKTGRWYSQDEKKAINDGILALGVRPATKGRKK